MKCPFCPTVEIVKGLDDYRCTTCGAFFIYRNKDLLEWKFFKKVKKTIFRVQWSSQDNKIYITPSTPPLELDGSMNINPHNIATKLPTILTFS